MIKEIINEIKNADTILVAGHIMPDGDDLSSVTSMVMGLEKIGKKVVGVIDDEIPEYLSGFEAINKCVRDFDCAKNNPADLIIIVDASSPDRVGRVQDLFEYKRVIVIDHHATNLNYGNINWVVPESASAAQLVLEVLKELNVEYDEELATINLLGIATDTGFFKYSNTNSKVFTDAAYLVDKGANLNKITNQILENKPIEHIKLMKDVLEEMKFEFDNKLAYSTVSLEMLNKYGIEQKDTPPFVGDLRSLRGVEVAIMYNQAEDNEYHISMRSKSWFDVSKVAVHFGGGGHKKAAGFSYKTDNIEELMKKVSNFIGEKL